MSNGFVLKEARDEKQKMCKKNLCHDMIPILIGWFIFEIYVKVRKTEIIIINS